MGLPDHLRNRRLLDAYADDELEGTRRLRVAAHLQHCAVCRRDLLLTDRMKAHLAVRRLLPFECRELERGFGCRDRDRG